jgi:hypothetical protein
MILRDCRVYGKGGRVGEWARGTLASEEDAMGWERERESEGWAGGRAGNMRMLGPLRA